FHGTDSVARPNDREVIWWTDDGLLLTITGDQDPLDVDEVADLAATFETVTEEEWTAAGGT
ncbi:MAG: hypothetical protein OEV40_27220, partial [Acidimicrobiia bacterium]|nr:hypothetical protein [Acidimicrobiia bacterium]